MLNFFHKIFTFVLRKILSLCGAASVGVRVIVINSQQQILLVKHTYQKYWYLPGGGIKNNESVQQAVIRELHEETGVVATAAPQLLGIYVHQMMGVTDYPILFLVNKFNLETAPHSAEIAAREWFSYEKLPADISPATLRRLDEIFKNVERSERW